MALFVGYICNNRENIPANVSEMSHVRVRIPQFHGDPNNTTGNLYYTDSQLPWARVTPPSDAQDFCATGYYEDGTVVLVDILNNDLTNLLISGPIGNYKYTNDPTEIAARAAAMSGQSNATSVVNYTTETSEANAKTIVAKALKEANTRPVIHDNGCNNVKYNTWYYGREVSGENYPWCCAFVCWIFDQCGLRSYFNGGNKTALCSTLYNYHKSKGEAVAGTDYKAGDLLFMNFTGGTSITHVEIAVTDYDSKTNTIDCVGGNIYHKLADGTVTSKVGRETRKRSQIVAAIRTGSAICANRNDPKWKQFDSKWKNDIMSTKTIGQVGCAMTSISILLRMTGLTKSNFSPAVLNEYLKTHGGYTNNSIYWAKTNGYVDSWKYVNGGTLSGSDSQKLATIKDFLADGYYIVLAVKNAGHWVAVTGYAGNDILMSDPGKSNATKVFATYGGNTVTRYQLYSCKNKFTTS